MKFVGMTLLHYTEPSNENGQIMKPTSNITVNNFSLEKDRLIKEFDKILRQQVTSEANPSFISRVEKSFFVLKD